MKRIPRLSAVLLLCLLAGTAFAQSLLGVTVYKSPYCGCCHLWIEHLQKNGFQVSAKDVDDTAPHRQRLGMPAKLGSCHTAVVGGYVIESRGPGRAGHAVGLAGHGIGAAAAVRHPVGAEGRLDQSLGQALSHALPEIRPLSF